MYLCLHRTALGTVTATEVELPASCPATDFLAVSSTALADTLTMSQLFQTYFQFDAELFGYLIGANIVAYAMGLSTGYIVRLIIGPKLSD